MYRSKLSQNPLARTRFQRNTANPGTYHRFCSPALRLKRCVAPMLSRKVSRQKFSQNALNERSSNEKMRSKMIVSCEASSKFTERACKSIVWCDASDNFHRKSCQNDRLLPNSQNELAKALFRAMLPTIFTEKAAKMIVWCEASSKFHRTSLRQFSQKKLPT